jgi:hypothetical protein
MTTTLTAIAAGNAIARVRIILDKLGASYTVQPGLYQSKIAVNAASTLQAKIVRAKLSQIVLVAG